MDGFKAFEMMKEGKIVCVTNCENVGYRLKNGFIVEQDLVIEDEPVRPANFDFNLSYDIFNEKRLEKTTIELTERELNLIVYLLKELRKCLTIKFNEIDHKEIKKILSLKRNLSYDCEAFITKFEKERKKNYPDVVEIEENKESLEKLLDLAIYEG